MKLIMSPPSPFARKVRVLLRETGLIDRVEEVEVSSTPLNSAPEILAANPLGKIPALLRENGPALYDSRVITRYLDEKTKANLYPAASLYEVLTLESTADAIMDVTVGMVYGARFRTDTTEWTDAQWAKAARAVAAIDSRWMSHLTGPLTMAQIAVSCALSYLDLRHDARKWRDGNDTLATWQAKFEGRDAMQATKP